MYFFSHLFRFLVSFRKPYKIFCFKSEHFLNEKDYFSWGVFCKSLMGRSWFYFGFAVKFLLWTHLDFKHKSVLLTWNCIIPSSKIYETFLALSDAIAMFFHLYSKGSLKSKVLEPLTSLMTKQICLLVQSWYCWIERIFSGLQSLESLVYLHVCEWVCTFLIFTWLWGNYLQPIYKMQEKLLYCLSDV